MTPERKLALLDTLNRFKGKIRRPFKRLVRLAQYAPIIWRNEDWDYAWLYELLEYKLRRVERELRDDPHHMFPERRADQVKRARLCIKRLMEGKYVEKDYDDMERRFGPYTRNLERAFVITQKDKDAYHKAVKRVIKREEYMQQQDMDYFFKIFKKYHRGWWV